MKEIPYNRNNVIEYARKWAYGRNPQYYNFDNVGGDCTSFVSQCIYAGSKVMNYSKQNGWYYINGNNKSPSWSGVKFLHNFLTQNKYLSPLFAIIIGLIPNCASSVLIANLFVLNALPFGACLSGLIVNAGLGSIYILKSKEHRKDFFIIIGFLIMTALIAGYLGLLIWN